MKISFLCFFVLICASFVVMGQGKSIDDILGQQTREGYEVYRLKKQSLDTITTIEIPANYWHIPIDLTISDRVISIDYQGRSATIEDTGLARKKYLLEKSKIDKDIRYLLLSVPNENNFIQLVINKSRNIILYIYSEDEMYHLIYYLY